ncbi:MAG: PfkB family carbohydrate kinase [Myxococcales bacterium]
MRPLRLAVVGHVEYVEMADVTALPGPGEILHLDAPRRFAGGGGAMAFQQLVKSGAEVHFFTALGEGDAGRAAEAELSALPGRLHAARRAGPHPRAVVLVPHDGDRTIVVVGRPLHPEASDPLPYELLARCDGVYFTAEDPALLRLARAARVVVATARRKVALERAGVAVDVVVGSVRDSRERSALRDYARAPAALVMTDGERGGTVETEAGVAAFAPAAVKPPGPSYGAGDSYAAALTYFLAAGLPVLEAAGRAAAYGAALIGASLPSQAQARLSAP